jgi:hypothetical protein
MTAQVATEFQELLALWATNFEKNQHSLKSLITARMIKALQ